LLECRACCYEPGGAALAFYGDKFAAVEIERGSWSVTHAEASLIVGLVGGDAGGECGQDK
jgi:hypothetical protein